MTTHDTVTLIPQDQLHVPEAQWSITLSAPLWRSLCLLANGNPDRNDWTANEVRRIASDIQASRQHDLIDRGLPGILRSLVEVGAGVNVVRGGGARLRNEDVVSAQH